MRCIYCKRKADVIKYGKSLCLYHTKVETIIKQLSIGEGERLLKMTEKERVKEFDKLVKENYNVRRKKAK